jgi:hypothetical protein
MKMSLVVLFMTSEFSLVVKKKNGSHTLLFLGAASWKEGQRDWFMIKTISYDFPSEKEKENPIDIGQTMRRGRAVVAALGPGSGGGGSVRAGSLPHFPTDLPTYIDED